VIGSAESELPDLLRHGLEDGWIVLAPAADAFVGGADGLVDDDGLLVSREQRPTAVERCQRTGAARMPRDVAAFRVPGAVFDGPERDRDFFRHDRGERPDVLRIVERPGLCPVPGLVGDFEQAVRMAGADASDLLHVPPHIDTDRRGVGQRDGFDVQVVLLREIEELRQRVLSIYRRQREQPVGHGQYPDDGQVFRLCPRQIGVRISRASVRHELDEAERADAAPFEGRAVSVDEVRAGDAQVDRRERRRADRRAAQDEHQREKGATAFFCANWGQPHGRHCTFLSALPLFREKGGCPLFSINGLLRGCRRRPGRTRSALLAGQNGSCTDATALPDTRSSYSSRR
jgi:hypothetical protein